MSRPQRHKFHSLYLWHRYTGIVCSVLVLVLAITGLLIQHADKLKLQQHYLSNTSLLDWYGIGTDTITSFDTGDNWISQVSNYIYLDQQAIQGHYDELRGAVATEFGFAAVTGNDLVLMSKAGELIETLTAKDNLPEHALGIAQTSRGVVIRGSNRYWLGDTELIQWHPYKGPHPEWVQATTATSNITIAVQQHQQHHQISWERFLLDLHSGRLFGKYGFLIMDIAAIGLILLACSGLWVWSQRRQKDKLHAKDAY